MSLRRTRSGTGRPSVGILLFLWGYLLSGGSAQATLGAPADSIQSDQIRFKGVRRESVSLGMRSHVISLSDGSSIKQFVNAQGVVFAVSWSTRLKPDLAALLGPHFASYAAASGAPTGIADSKRQRSVRAPNLVVHQAGRMNAFGGLAYVPSLVPEGVDADSLR